MVDSFDYLGQREPEANVRICRWRRLHSGLRGILMEMRNPPHPGEFIDEVDLKPFNLSIRSLPSKFGVATSTLSRLVKQQSGVSPEMALRLSKALGSSAESWLAMQTQS